LPTCARFPRSLSRAEGYRNYFQATGRFGFRLRVAFQARAYLNRIDVHCLLAKAPSVFVASPSCFRSLTVVWLTDILGLDVTPVLSGPEQSPLGASRLPQAPKSHRFSSLLRVASGQPVEARFSDDLHRLSIVSLSPRGAGR